MQAVFPTLKPGDLRKAMQGARIRTSAILQSLGFLASEAADKDKLAAISSFAAKTVTTIQRSPDVKARNFFRIICSHLLVARPSRQPLLRRTKIRVQDTRILTYPHWRQSPKESLPVKKATDTGTCCTSSRSTIDTAAEITPAIPRLTVLLLQSPLSLTLKCVCNE
ncbi:hypothetical protein BASA83_012547 [Batrachochytrium salamandrivorans]|nr:hypothetical protein BASA83_012547 [Batrachochytrium salamandrivorans]